MSKFADPTSDFGFKKLFVDPKNKSLLISFLNSILGRKGKDLITNAIVADPNNLPTMAGDKHSIVDVRCKDEKGKNYIIEIQVENEHNFPQRCVYYAARALTLQLEAKQDYKEILPVIFVGILGFKLFKWNHSTSHLFITDQKTGEIAFDTFEWHIVELPKFKKTENEIKTDEERWLYLLKNAATLNYMPPCLEKLKATEHAMEVLDRHLWSNEEMEVFERVLHAERVQRSVMETAISEGELKGRAEGEQVGELKGRQVVAKQMLVKGLAVDLIRDVTGLSEEEIKKIK
jgi:predicted transposase/invertase (TIGR01784 family)